ncbi:MAG: hypothetical protein Q9164_002439 [Protoblastenia rupestris]
MTPFSTFFLAFFTKIFATFAFPASNTQSHNSKPPVQSPARNVTTNDMNPLCIEGPPWMDEGLVTGHCEAAIRRFFDEEVQNHGTRRFQFLAPDASPFYPYITSVHTPRKYAVGSCVLTVAFLGSDGFPYIPGQGVGPFERVQRASFSRILYGTQAIWRDCVAQHGGLRAGWKRIPDQASVDSKDLAVFLWTTGSMMDRLSGPGVNNERNCGPCGNGTIVNPAAVTEASVVEAYAVKTNVVKVAASTGGRAAPTSVEGARL